MMGVVAKYGAGLLAAAAIFALPVAAQQAGSTPAPAAPTGAAAEDARLNAFLDAAFDASLALSPESMTSLGLKTEYDRLDDYTDAGAARALALRESQLAQLRRDFDPARLGPEGRVSYRLFEQAVEQDRRQFAWRDHGFPVSTNGSPAGEIPVFLINQHRVENVEDARAYIARIVDAERVMGEVAGQIRSQAQKGIVPPKMVFEPARADAELVITGAPFDDGADSTVLADFREKVTALELDAATRDTLVAEASAALAGPFRRGFDTLFAALDAVEPLATGNNGAWSLPDGGDYYQARLAYYTTTDMTAEQIHQLGLDQVAAIRAEMDAARQQMGYAGTLDELIAAVRTDPQYRFPNDDSGKEQYLTESRAVIAKIMAKAPEYFHRLPEAALEVRAVEPWRQETASVAFYNRPAPDGSRPGIFYVNLADMTQVSRLQVESIAAHEGAPGHHFQIARAQELPGLPKFRRFGFYGSYIEGWGLYSERLAGEMGLYQTPEARFGMLSLQMWRAIRMVVDTGMHAKRWTREQAIDYFRANSPVSERDIAKEIDRYLNNPGQATSYMVGQLHIAGLRKKAEAALGERFDLRDFHEVVLGNGSVPLEVLTEQVDAYIAGKQA
ncbi:DUF885 domain-containing protein [Croceibacterium ferulae]|uniref:DUF885 domain-containing protein n=1 Tax=Croceibacterium ferulae TaxID=1854641 RepID=UPI001F4EAA99|nr:DUF885 domain-containing protein [Croceibacterium ferulae]